MTLDIETIVKEMSEFAADIVDVRVDVLSEDVDGMCAISAWLSEDVSRDTAMSLCRGWAQLLRKSIPDRREDYSSGISLISPLGQTLGIYFVGWAGHKDAWWQDHGTDAPDQNEWEALHQRLDEYLGARGKSDLLGGGNYFLFDEPSGHADQSLTMYRIEFLTPDLMSGIQEILKDGYADWSVYVVLDLIPPVDGIESDGLQIFADRVVERWNRALMVERLGERLKV